MLSYRDHHWLLIHGPSRFSAAIGSGTRTPEDVWWYLELHYVAGGPQWRRVRSYQRPQFHLSVGFHLKERKWTSLEEVNFWNTKKDGGSPLARLLGEMACMCDLYYKESPDTEAVMTSFCHCNWRVIERDGARFSVELAADESAQLLLREPPKSEVVVLPDGTEETIRETEDESWKANVHVYAMEQVPFGLVRVKVPRNAGDVVAFAQARARHLLGLTKQPEHVVVSDFASSDSDCPTIKDELHVNLHYHGRHEEQ